MARQNLWLALHEPIKHEFEGAGQNTCRTWMQAVVMHVILQYAVHTTHTCPPDCHLRSGSRPGNTLQRKSRLARQTYGSKLQHKALSILSIFLYSFLAKR